MTTYTGWTSKMPNHGSALVRAVLYFEVPGEVLVKGEITHTDDQSLSLHRAGISGRRMHRHYRVVRLREKFVLSSITCSHVFKTVSE
jgi:hypothetical protein